jgi:hypothetical protein
MSLTRVVLSLGRWYFSLPYQVVLGLIRVAIDDGSLYYKSEVLKQYHDETIAVIEQSLSWDPKPQEQTHPNPAIQSFWDLGVDIRSRGTPGLFSIFLQDFMKKTIY